MTYHHHLARNNIKHKLTMNDLFLSPSLHHVHHRNQNRSLSQGLKKSQSTFSLSLKEFHLSEKDFYELQQALKTIFHYTKTVNLYNKQRLTSPYLQQRSDNDDQSSLPLYTNEYFIRNGLLNHNDGPNIRDNSFQSIKFSYPSSSMNTSLPLALLSNQKYLFTALTSNFISDKSRHRSQSNMELNRNNEDDSESIMIRRNKVQAWERENILQQNKSMTYSDDHRSSIVQTPSLHKDDMTIEESNKEEKNTDDLFPMVKVLAPYIIIRNSFHLNSNNNHSSSRPSAAINSRNNDIQHVNNLTEKRPLTDVSHPMFVAPKRQSSLLASSCIIDHNNEQYKKNYLLAEFESVLTQISKEQHF